MLGAASFEADYDNNDYGDFPQHTVVKGEGDSFFGYHLVCIIPLN